MRHLPAFASICLLTAGVASAQETDRGAQLLAPFKRDLQQALADGLAEGPEAAIGACRVQAPEIAARLSQDGIRVGRTSERLRNPANTAPSWVLPILSAFTDDPAERTPRAVQIGEDRLGYAEPIVVQPLCLTCHGNDLSPELEARIRELYPQDQAQGYEAGDLRGVFWVEFPQTR